MALSKKKRQSIKQEAMHGASHQFTVKEAEVFEKDYEAVIIALNEALENRLETFGSEAIPILRSRYQSRPSGILSVIEEEKDKIRNLSQAMMAVFENVRDPSFRFCAASCIKDVVDICTNSVAEEYKRGFDRAKMTLQ